MPNPKLLEPNLSNSGAIYTRQIVGRWAETLWGRYPSPAHLKKRIEGAQKQLAKASKSSWEVVTDPVVVSLLAMKRLGWRPTCTGTTLAPSSKWVSGRGQQSDRQARAQQVYEPLRRKVLRRACLGHDVAVAGWSNQTGLDQKVARVLQSLGFDRALHPTQANQAR